MKKNALIILLSFMIASVQAQNPYQGIGKKEKVHTLSKGKYIEFFPKDSLVQIGSVMLNPKTGKVVSFVKEEHKPKVKADVSSRFMSVDPLAKEYYNITPYAYVMNNPVKYIDPDGRVVVDANGNVVVTTRADQKHDVKAINETSTVQNGNIIVTEVIVEFDFVYIYADDGTAIEATMQTDAYTKTTTYAEDGSILGKETTPGIDESKYNCSTNCHGLTFANGKIRIGDNEVPKLLKGDNYKDTKEKKADAVIFYDKYNGKLNHSASRNSDGTYNSNNNDDITFYGTNLDVARRGDLTDKKKDRFVKKKKPNRIVNTAFGKVKDGKRIISNPQQINSFINQMKR